jgi:DtxR family transcriptional regulator, Mn-dependent transcriptional regulator
LLIKINYRVLKLSDLLIGDSARLCALDKSTNDFLVFLNKKGIALNMEIKIDGREPFDDSLLVSYGDQSQVVLSKEICDRLLVEKV